MGKLAFSVANFLRNSIILCRMMLIFAKRLIYQPFPIPDLNKKQPISDFCLTKNGNWWKNIDFLENTPPLMNKNTRVHIA